MNDLNSAWLDMLGIIMTFGKRVEPRGTVTRELLNHTLVVDMTRCMLTVKGRKLGYRFMAAEAAWMLGGDNLVSTIAPYSKTISQFSDDGFTFFGAYGPRLKAQLTSVAKALAADPGTRRAVANIWREDPPKTKDYPCHLSCQFMIREERLHCFTTMRSSDAWLGVPYDIFNFSMWSAYVLLFLEVNMNIRGLKLGQLHNTAASRHLYLANWDDADRCVENPEAFDYYPLDPLEFSSTVGLVHHLWQVARQQPRFHAWLKELP